MKKTIKTIGKILAALLCLAAAFLFISHFTGRPATWEGEKEPDRSGEAEAKDEHLYLYLTEDSVLLGEKKELELSLFYGEDLEGDIAIEDESGAVVCTVENNGRGSATAALTVYETEERVGELTAVCGEHRSQPVHFYVHPEITEDMIDTLLDTAEALRAFVEEAAFEDQDSEEARAQVTAFLQGREQVAWVEENSGIVFYQTVDGLIGSYGLGRYEEGYAGFSDPERTFRRWQKEQPVDDCVLSSGIPPTNNRILIMAPDYNDETMQTQNILNSKMFEESQEELGIEAIDELRDADARRCLETGAFTDYGFCMLNAHGRVIQRADGTPMLFFVFAKGDEESLREYMVDPEADNYNFWSKSARKQNKLDFENFRLTVDVSVNETTEEEGAEPTRRTEVTVLASTRYMESVLSNRTFDNTIFYFNTCYALADPYMSANLTAHGASLVIGCEDSYTVAYSLAVIAKLIDVWKTAGSDGMYGATVEALRNIDFSAYSLFADFWGRHEEEITEIMREEDDYKEGDYFKELLNAHIAFNTSIEEGRTVTWVSRTGDCENRVLQGTCQMSGTVLTEHGKAVKNATVTLYRWMNHRFIQEAETTTGRKGEYQAEVPVGVYVIQAEVKTDEKTLRGMVSESLDKAGDSAEPILLDDYKLLGVVRDAETGEPVPEATVLCDDGIEPSRVLTDEGGSFEIEDLLPGWYTVSATKAGYTPRNQLTIKIKADTTSVLLDDILLDKDKTSSATNNGGYVVRYQGYDYYWKNIAEGVTNGEFFARYSEGMGRRDMIRRSPDGEQETIFSAEGVGRIYILEDRMFLAGPDGAFSVELDGSGRRDYAGVELLALDETQSALYGRQGDDFIRISGDSGETEVVVSGSYGYKGGSDGNFFFSATDEVTGDIVLYYFDGQMKEMGRIGKRGDAGGTWASSVGDICKAGDTLYYSYGYYAGTGMFFQDGGIVSVKLDENGNPGSPEVCVEKTGAEAFYVAENNGQTEIYYYTETSSMRGFWDDEVYSGGKVKNLDTGETRDSDFSFSRPGSFVYLDGAIVAIDRDRTSYTTLIPKELADSFGCRDLNWEADGEITVIRKAELVDDTVYFTVEKSVRDKNQDYFWRPFYVRTVNEVYSMKLGSGQPTLLYSY